MPNAHCLIGNHEFDFGKKMGGLPEWIFLTTLLGLPQLVKLIPMTQFVSRSSSC